MIRHDAVKSIRRRHGPLTCGRVGNVNGCHALPTTYFSLIRRSPRTWANQSDFPCSYTTGRSRLHVSNPSRSLMGWALVCQALMEPGMRMLMTTERRWQKMLDSRRNTCAKSGLKYCSAVRGLIDIPTRGSFLFSPLPPLPSLIVKLSKQTPDRPR